MEEKTVELNVLDCNPWGKGQCIIKISKQDYALVDGRSRLMKRSPEYWIFVNTGELDDIHNGRTTFYVTTNKNGRKSYSLFPEHSHENVPEINYNFFSHFYSLLHRMLFFHYEYHLILLC